MTNLREAAQMALDVLELVDGYVMGKHEAKEALYETLAQPEQEPWGYISHRSWKMPVFVEADDLEVSGLPFNNPDYTPVYKAPPQREWQNAALRLGEELSTVGPDGYYNMSASEWLDWAMNHITPARIEQEPPCKTGSQCVSGKCERCAAQEPVAYKVTSKLGEYCGFKSSAVKKGDLIYTAPPQREWRGLTAAERIDIVNKAIGLMDGISDAEAKLKEKNCAPDK